MKKASIVMALALCVALVACTVDQVLSDINICIQTAATLETAIGAVSPADAAILTSLTSIATAGLNAIEQDYNTWKASGATSDLAKLNAACQSLQTNLSQNLAAAHISDPVAVQKATAWVGLITSTVGAMTALWPQVSGLSDKRTIARIGAAKLPSAKELQYQWQTQVCMGSVPCGKLVKAH